MKIESTLQQDAIQTLEKSWFEWLLHNIEQGCAPQELLKILLENNVPAPEAQVAISQAIHAVENRKNPGWTACSQAFMQTTLPDQTVIDLGDIKVRLLMRLKRPDIAFFENVLSNSECDELIEIAQRKLKPAMVFDETQGITIESATRTATAATFDKDALPIVSRIDERLSKLVNWPMDSMGPLEVVNYQVNDKFTPHYDYFSAQTLAGDTSKKRRQQMATVVLYLNDVESGGETSFPYVGLNVAPKKGCALFFAYTDLQTGGSDTLSLHSSLPVVAGEKWIGVKILLEHVTS